MFPIAFVASLRVLLGLGSSKFSVVLYSTQSEFSANAMVRLAISALPRPSCVSVCVSVCQCVHVVSNPYVSVRRFIYLAGISGQKQVSWTH